MPTGITGIGTTFRKWDDTAGAWTTLSKVESISGPTFSRNVIDDTTFDSTGGYQEFITGLRDAGELTFTMKFTRDNYDEMKTDFESDSAGFYEIVLPDDDVTTFELEGYVTEMPLDIPLDDTISIDVTIKISGEVVVNSGSFTSSANTSNFPTP